MAKVSTGKKLTSGAWLRMTFFVFLPGLYLAFHEQSTYYLPSLFESSLSDKAYLYWHRWVDISFTEYCWLAFIPFFIYTIFFLNFDPVYHFVQKFGTWIGIAFALIIVCVIIYRDVVGGFAIYDDHLMARLPYTHLATKRYDTKDVARIEVGCHQRYGRLGRGSNTSWSVPSYKIIFKNGDVISPFDLADGGYRDEKLLHAVMQFDEAVRAAGVPRIYRKNFLGMEMNGAVCFSRMANRYQDADGPALDRIFKLD